MVASEAVPYSKTGGLADVAGALPQALQALGHEVAVVLPLYRMTHLDDRATLYPSLTVPIGPNTRFPSVLTATQNGVKFYFVSYPVFFDRAALYGTPEGDYPDNAERFALFSRAAVEIAQLDFRPDVLHCHDWQSALAPVLLKSVYAKSAVARAPVLFTIHNLGYQGLFRSDILEQIGVPRSLFTIDGLEFYGKVNLLKGGIVYSDAINTVSRGYAREIQTEEYGFGLEGLLRHRSLVLSGILNGVDYSQWDPATDKFLAANYSPANLSGKKKCKQDLLQQFGFPADRLDQPVIGIVSRLSEQKGADLIAEASGELMAEALSLVVLGSGDAVYEDLFRKLAERYPGKVAVRIAYDNAVAHKIEAGADMFLMPSRYEPCGLNQIYSLKYGTVPVVRATGGLDDTVTPFDEATGQGNGFKFSDYSAAAMMQAIRAAIDAYRKPEQWRKLMLGGMGQDFSWSSSAAQYVKLYESLVAARRASG